jgi:hypothetical protein
MPGRTVTWGSRFSTKESWTGRSPATSAHSNWPPGLSKPTTPSCNVPALVVVPPENGLVPVNVSMPVPMVATLTEMAAAAVAAAARHFPAPAREWLVTGGGRHNPGLMDALGRHLDETVRRVESVGWDGDALEAQAFAYLAVRSIEGLPLSLPSTTGVPRPTRGGRLFPGSDRETAPAVVG